MCHGALPTRIPPPKGGSPEMCLVPDVRALLLCSSCLLQRRDRCARYGACDCATRVCREESRGIFGQRLEDTVRYERKFGPRLAPLLVEQCVDFIRERGLHEEGLFRMPGQANLVKDLQEAFDCGDKPLFDSNTDVHTVASLLKLYLRELPEPVVPFAKYDDFLTCAQLLAKDGEEGIQELGRQVKTLPQANYNLLKYICRFLDEVQTHSNENKMSVQNLATVFGPNILRPRMEDPVTIMEGTSLVQHLMTVLISEHERLYTGEDTESLEAQEAQPEIRSLGPRNMVCWISEEDLQSGCATSKGSSSGPEDPGGGGSSLDVQVGTPATVTFRPEGNPSKQVKSLPAWKCSFRSTGAKLGGSTGDVSGMTGGSWLISGLSSLRGHRRTSSGEPARDSASSQRLSTYDNVTSSSLSVPSVTSTPWSTSSCEISVPDSGSDPSAANGRKGDKPGLGMRPRGQPLEQDALEIHMSGGGCSNDSSKAAVWSSDTEESSKALSRLVEELQEELRKQKLSYEARIKKLEEASAVLHTQVEQLEREAELERRRQRLLEIKLRNSERARQDAETRNQLLEREMEGFFSTLGDPACSHSARTSHI
ncbi:rho GTPase-activating protein 22 isoform X1 [Scleropages formosus]|uniref:rho GTPase-activating protein 22 isoform X1 n=1 Tax=Scleropages formosus TaxID=113540 RepID=UPI0010FA9951|nr:rho GTPase-activating protein 22-like isoform X1 [Scleropages formosus]